MLSSATASEYGSEAYAKLSAQMDTSLQSALGLNDAIVKLSKEKGISIEEARALVAQLGEETDAMHDNTSAHEEAIEKYESAVSSIQTLQGVY